MKTTYTLITNVDNVWINDLRMQVSALAICNEGWRERHEMGARKLLVGYGVECAWLVFDLEITSTEYTLVQHELQFKDGPLCKLGKADFEHDFDIEKFEFDHDPPFTTFTTTLAEKVARYWRAPYMPSLFWDKRARSGARNIRASKRGT